GDGATRKGNSPASDDHTARVWDAKDGRLLTELKGHGNSVTSATFSPDGQRILTASGDTTARLWDAKDGRFLAELKGHGAYITSATFSPDGQRILTTSEDKTARVCDASPETRTHAQITQLLRCHVPAQFASDGSSLIIFRQPTPQECQNLVPALPLAAERPQTAP